MFSSRSRPQREPFAHGLHYLSIPSPNAPAACLPRACIEPIPFLSPSRLLASPSYADASPTMAAPPSIPTNNKHNNNNKNNNNNNYVNTPGPSVASHGIPYVPAASLLAQYSALPDRVELVSPIPEYSTSEVWYVPCHSCYSSTVLVSIVPSHRLLRSFPPFSLTGPRVRAPPLPSALVPPQQPWPRILASSSSPFKPPRPRPPPLPRSLPSPKAV